MVRPPRTPGEGEASWDAAAGLVDTSAIEGADAVVHLAGENIAGGRWTDEKKRKIRESRVRGTELIAKTVAGCENPPKVLATASAVGWYGNRYGEVMREYAAAGEGFLADVCKEWESAADLAKDRTRVVKMRIGVILSREGGALKRMLLPFKLGVGGKLGSGDQYMSWITLDDVVVAIVHCLERDVLKGPVNLTAPNPVTNQTFTKTLGKVLVRPTILPMPGFAARLAFGEMAQELLLQGQRVIPERLQQTGFRFQHPHLEGALRAVLEK